jgi:hypothetical protein
VQVSPETKKTLSHLLTQAARLLGIDNGSLRVDYLQGQPKKLRPTPTIRLGGQKDG